MFFFKETIKYLVHTREQNVIFLFYNRVFMHIRERDGGLLGACVNRDCRRMQKLLELRVSFVVDIVWLFSVVISCTIYYVTDSL